MRKQFQKTIDKKNKLTDKYVRCYTYYHKPETGKLYCQTVCSEFGMVEAEEMSVAVSGPRRAK